jgi:hypothetical protein
VNGSITLDSVVEALYPHIHFVVGSEYLASTGFPILAEGRSFIQFFFS